MIVLHISCFTTNEKLVSYSTDRLSCTLGGIWLNSAGNTNPCAELPLRCNNCLLRVLVLLHSWREGRNSRRICKWRFPADKSLGFRAGHAGFVVGRTPILHVWTMRSQVNSRRPLASLALPGELNYRQQQQLTISQHCCEAPVHPPD